MTLNMGCGFWNIINHPTDLPFNTTIAEVFVNEVDPVFYLYEFGNFTIFPEYCDILGYAPANVMHESWDGGLTFINPAP
jgi:hypothetical protein